MITVLDIKQQSLVAMSRFEGSVLTLDERFILRRYNYSPRIEELRIYQESELIEGAALSLKLIPSDMIPRFISMTDTELYVGARFYQNYSKYQTNKDDNQIFEKHRNKRIGNLSFRNLLIGPLSSIDNSHLLFVREINVDKDGKAIIPKRRFDEDETKTNSQTLGASLKNFDPRQVLPLS